MSAADKLGGYASGFGNLDAAEIAANVTEDYKLLEKDGKVVGRDDLPGYSAELRLKTSENIKFWEFWLGSF